VWKRAQFRWETVPDRGTHSHGALCCLMAVRTYGTTESPLEAEQRGDPIENVSREQVDNVWHVITDVAILGDTTNHPNSRPKNTI